MVYLLRGEYRKGVILQQMGLEGGYRSIFSHSTLLGGTRTRRTGFTCINAISISIIIVIIRWYFSKFIDLGPLFAI